MTQSKRVIILNGPPSSGKDTAANIIEKIYDAEHLRFKSKLYQITALINNIDLDEFIKIATDVELKDSQIIARGRTARQMLIHTSENVIKSNYGDEYFGNDVGISIKQSDNNLFVISDSGFVQELYAMIRSAELTGSNLTIIKLYRDGYTFENDSRDYIPDSVIEYLDSKCYKVHNSGDYMDFKNSILQCVEQL